MNSDAAAAPPSTQEKPTAIEPAQISYALGNTYSLLPTSSAPLDHTRRHRKIHDWVLYIDILPGCNPDLIDRVTFDMRDDSFRGMSFTCHCPIRTKVTSVNSTAATTTISRESGETTAESKQPSTNPRPLTSSRWRFSTRQQTYGPVDVTITLRGVGGSKSVLDYQIALREGSPEQFGVFVEKRPNSVLRPIKMTDGRFVLRLLYGIVDTNADADNADKKDVPISMGMHAENRMLLQQIAKSIYSRSKRPMRAVLHNPANGESWMEEWFRSKKEKDGDTAWTLSFDYSTLMDRSTDLMQSAAASAAEAQVVSILSPSLTGGEGLNECYKIIEGLPSYLTTASTTCRNESRKIMTMHSQSQMTNQNQKVINQSQMINQNQIINQNQLYTQREHSIHVQIDVSQLTILQIIKVCQNFVKYEDAIDCFMPWYKRENCSPDCQSNKLAMAGNNNLTSTQLNNKDRNNMIARCTSFQDLLSCLNPNADASYKLNLRNLISSPSNNNKLYIEFRQHPTSKDKTTTTNWIRFCMAFVKNSARLRAPNPLKNTTSIEDEFDLLFEYVIKDRALRNFYREKRDGYAAREEEERLERLGSSTTVLEGNLKNDQDDMSISNDGSDEEDEVSYDANSNLKREAEATVGDVHESKRHCL